MELIPLGPTHHVHTFASITAHLGAACRAARFSLADAERALAVIVGTEAHPAAVIGFNLRGLIEVVALNAQAPLPAVPDSESKTTPPKILLYTAMIHRRTHAILCALGWTLVALDVAPPTIDVAPLATITPATVGLVLVTHVLGEPLRMDALVAWANRHGVPVFEDCAQGGWLHDYRGHPGATYVGWSCGVDKIPCAMGGGFVLTRAGEAEALRARVGAYPVEARAARQQTLVLELGRRFMLTTRSGLTLMWRLLCFVSGKSGVELLQSIRNNGTGFVHSDFRKRPSDWMASAVVANAHPARSEALVRRFRTGYACLHARFPALFTAETAVFNNYLLLTVPAGMMRADAMRHLCANGVLCVAAQTWMVADGRDAPRAAALVERYVWLPTLHVARDAELDAMSAALEGLRAPTAPRPPSGRAPMAVWPLALAAPVVGAAIGGWRAAALTVGIACVERSTYAALRRADYARDTAAEVGHLGRMALLHAATTWVLGLGGGDAASLRRFYPWMVGFWCQTVVGHLCQAPRATDWKIMLAHHGFTLWLLAVSWGSPGTRAFGGRVMATMFISDVPLDVTRIANALELNAAHGLPLAELGVLATLVAWGWMRLYGLGRLIADITYSLWSTYRYTWSTRVTVVAVLCALYAMNVYWYWRLARVALRALKGAR